MISTRLLRRHLGFVSNMIGLFVLDETELNQPQIFVPDEPD